MKVIKPLAHLRNVDPIRSDWLEHLYQQGELVVSAASARGLVVENRCRSVVVARNETLPIAAERLVFGAGRPGSNFFCRGQVGGLPKKAGAKAPRISLQKRGVDSARVTRGGAGRNAPREIPDNCLRAS